MDTLIKDVVGEIIRCLADVDFGIPAIAFALTNRRCFWIYVGVTYIKYPDKPIKPISEPTLYDGFKKYEQILPMVYDRMCLGEISRRYMVALENTIRPAWLADRVMWRCSAVLRAAREDVGKFIKICEVFEGEINLMDGSFITLCKFLGGHSMSKSKFKRYTRRMFQNVYFNKLGENMEYILNCCKRFRHQLKSLYHETLIMDNVLRNT